MKILIATNNQGDGDWKGLYIDGKLIEEGHSLRLWDVLAQVKDRKEAIEALSELSLRNDQMESLGNSFPAFETELWEHERATSAAQVGHVAAQQNVAPDPYSRKLLSGRVNSNVVLQRAALRRMKNE